jgi:DNA repair protein RadC
MTYDNEVAPAGIVSESTPERFDVPAASLRNEELLNARHHLIHKETVSIGSLTESTVHPRELFFAAIQRHAAALILCHNHPFGDPTPSHDDTELTQRLMKAGELLGIEVLDHVIVVEDDEVSVKEKGLI